MSDDLSIIKQGLFHCKPKAECTLCPYFNNTKSCYVALHSEALKAIAQQEKTIACLMVLNNKLNTELQNSIGLTEGWDNLESES